MDNIKVIRNYNDANKLLDKGHKLIKIDRDYNNRKYMIFIFELDNTLLNDLDMITKERQAIK